MTFKNNNLEFDIVDVNISIRKDDGENIGGYTKNLSVTVSSASLIMEEFIDSYDSSYPIIITTSDDKYYTFENYKFESISHFITDNSSRMTISFNK